MNLLPAEEPEASGSKARFALWRTTVPLLPEPSPSPVDMITECSRRPAPSVLTGIPRAPLSLLGLRCLRLRGSRPFLLRAPCLCSFPAWFHGAGCGGSSCSWAGRRVLGAVWRDSLPPSQIPLRLLLAHTSVQLREETCGPATHLFSHLLT